MAMAFALGCSADLSPASVVNKTRVIAARVQVVGAPTRSNPSPGESVSIEVRVVGPGPRQPLQWLFVACVPADVGSGLPICTSTESIIEPCLNCESRAGALADPVIQFEVPAESELNEATSVVAFGAVCADGAVTSLESLASFFAQGQRGVSGCEDPNDEGALLFVEVPLQEGEEDNTQPTIASVQLGGSPWEDVAASSAQVGQCAGTPIRQLPPGTGPIAIGLTAATQSRQEYDDPVTGDSRCETLQISWLATSGEFDQSFGFLEGDTCASGTASNGSTTVGWLPPETAPADGILVRFHFVLRDGRGGTDWTERALCIVP